MSFTFNGVSSDTYNMRVEDSPNYPIARRVVEHFAIPGRNGDIIRDTGAWSNVDMTYNVYFDGESSSFQSAAHNIAMWLNGSHGYCRLEDTYDPDVYRMAVFSDELDLSNFRNKKGRAELTFSCKPQRYLKTGETVSVITGNTLSNPYMDCYPIYVISGNGNVTINGHSFSVSNNSSTIYVDSETKECWEGSIVSRRQVFPTVHLTSSNPTVTLPFNLNLTGLSSVFVSNKLSFGGGTYSFGPTKETVSSLTGVSFSLTRTRSDRTVTIVKSQGSNNVVYTLTAGSNADVRMVISSTSNTLGRISGDIVGVPHGGATVSKTVSSLSWAPRWWVL